MCVYMWNHGGESSIGKNGNVARLVLTRETKGLDEKKDRKEKENDWRKKERFGRVGQSRFC